MNTNLNNRKIVIYIFLFLLITIFIIIAFNNFIYINGKSMDPNIKDKSIHFINRDKKAFERNDIIVFTYEGVSFVKRIVGIENDRIEIKNGTIYCNEQKTDFYNDKFNNNMEKVTVPLSCYFVLGDNINNSFDSRDFGFITKESIDGRIKIKQKKVFGN